MERTPCQSLLISSQPGRTFALFTTTPSLLLLSNDLLAQINTFTAYMNVFWTFHQELYLILLFTAERAGSFLLFSRLRILSTRKL